MKLIQLHQWNLIRLFVTTVTVIVTTILYFLDPCSSKTGDETDDEMPHIEVPDVECTSREHGAAGGAATAGAGADICSQSDKCKCQLDNNAEKVFFLFFFFL